MLSLEGGGEAHAEFIERLAANPFAGRLKLADLAGNPDVRRLNSLTDEDVARLRRYQEAWIHLNELR